MSVTTLGRHAADTAPPIRPIGGSLRNLRSVSLREDGVRFAFGALVSLVAATVGDAAGPMAGGLFLAFPAILPASLTLIESHEGTPEAVAEVRGAVLGAAGMVAFACTAAALLTRSPGALALVAALAAWVVVSGVLYMAGRHLARLAGEQMYLPDVPSGEVEPVVLALRERGLRIAVAESCTGGILGALLTEVPGASAVVEGGVIAYTDATKTEQLGVPATLIAREGAVSDAVARAMAEGVRERLGVDVGVGITGLVGRPAEGKPAGLVYVAVAMPGGAVSSLRLADDRGPEGNRAQAVREALRLCAGMLGQQGVPQTA